MTPLQLKVELPWGGLPSLTHPHSQSSRPLGAILMANGRGLGAFPGLKVSGFYSASGPLYTDRGRLTCIRRLRVSQSDGVNGFTRHSVQRCLRAPNGAARYCRVGKSKLRCERFQNRCEPHANTRKLGLSQDLAYISELCSTIGLNRRARF